MAVNMGFRFMARMVMVMKAVVARMVMIVCVGCTAMGVLMEMFVQVLVAVCTPVMRMFVGVRMTMVVSVQMLVFVLSFHNKSSLS